MRRLKTRSPFIKIRTMSGHLAGVVAHMDAAVQEVSVKAGECIAVLRDAKARPAGGAC